MKSLVIYEEPIPSQLADALDLTKRVVEMGDDRRDTRSYRFTYSHIVSTFPSLWGPELLDLAMGEPLPDNAPQSEKLEQLANRLDTLCGQNIPADVKRAIEDIVAMSKGDGPQFLFPADREGNKRTNAYRLAKYQLEALEWAKLLVFYGNKAGEVQSTVASHYGTSWDAVRKWKSPVKVLLGTKFVDSVLSRASSGKSILLVSYKNGDDVEEMIKKTASAYHKELRKQAS
ncbi:hypothetical protein [Parasphingorhabdus sp.]|uniref:hypothetical protein n=1 Tax=Parasphingorhabdus sp. TaxID=2709688 RepID=UPI003266BD06